MSEGMRFAFFVFDSFLQNEAKPKHLQRALVRFQRLRRFEGDFKVFVFITTRYDTTPTLTLHRMSRPHRLSQPLPQLPSQRRRGYTEE